MTTYIITLIIFVCISFMFGAILEQRKYIRMLRKSLQYIQRENETLKEELNILKASIKNNTKKV